MMIEERYSIKMVDGTRYDVNAGRFHWDEYGWLTIENGDTRIRLNYRHIVSITIRGDAAYPLNNG